MISQTVLAAIAKFVAVGGLMAAGGGGVYFVATKTSDDPSRQVVAAETSTSTPTATAATDTPTSAATSSTLTTNAPAATATALFDAINRKYAAIGRATLAPGTADPLRPFANATPPPAVPVTPGPSPTPVGPQCGATIAGWPEILAKYGGFYKGNRCGPIGTQLIIMTRGRDGGPGAIATYQCQPADQDCLRGDAPSAADASWSVYPAPYPGPVTTLGGSTTLLIIDNGGAQICFDMTTHQYDLTLGCRP